MLFSLMKSRFRPPSDWGTMISKYAAALLAMSASLGACTPTPVPDPTLPPVLIQAVLTQQAARAAPTFPPPQVFIPIPSSSPRPVPVYEAAQAFSATLEPTRTPPRTVTSTVSPTSYTLPTRIPLPEEHYIKISGHHQYFQIGCETSAAVDWAAYFGVQLNEFDFQYKLPLSDNPDYGFVGDVNGPWGQVPPYDYGVYAGPVAAQLNAYGVAAKAVKNASIEMMKDQLAQDHPVIVWVIGNMVSGIPATYTDREGRMTVVAAYEHVVILTGFSEATQRMRYINNGHFFEIPYNIFLNSWNVLGAQAVIRE